MIVQTSDLNTAKAPLVLAVTGHRDLRQQDLEVLTARVTQKMLELRGKFPSTPFILLSPLAEGADRLVARVALRPEMKTRLVVPLPMPIDLYEHDFSGSKAEFHELLSQAHLWFIVPPHYDRQALATDKNARDLRYEAVGKYIVRECQILFALWNGIPSDKVGSTAAVVDFQTKGLPEQLGSSLQAPELFPVYHIVTPRRSEPSLQGTPYEMKEIYPQAFERDDAEGYYAKLFGNLENFNQQIADGGRTLAAEAATSETDLVGGLWGIYLTREEELALKRYSVADALAIRFQKRVTRTHLVLEWSVLFAFLCFVLFAHHDHHPPALLALSLGLLIRGYLTQKRARRFELDNKSQDYRAVAEGCRVAFFWHISGIKDSVSENYLAKQRTELDWIRTTLRGWDIEFEGKTQIPSEAAVTRLRFVLRHWVGGQLDYFARTAREQHKKLITMEFDVSIYLRLAVALAAAVLFTDLLIRFLHPEGLAHAEHEHWLVRLIILIDVLLARGALMHHSIQRQALAQHNKQYVRTRNIFQNASRLIRSSLPKNVPATRNWLLELGQRALEENADWVMLHRERPLELPHP